MGHHLKSRYSLFKVPIFAMWEFQPRRHGGKIVLLSAGIIQAFKHVYSSMCVSCLNED